jgi:hypothetical protein
MYLPITYGENIEYHVPMEWISFVASQGFWDITHAKYGASALQAPQLFYTRYDVLTNRASSLRRAEFENPVPEMDRVVSVPDMPFFKLTFHDTGSLEHAAREISIATIKIKLLLMTTYQQLREMRLDFSARRKHWHRSRPWYRAQYLDWFRTPFSNTAMRLRLQECSLS